MPCLPDNIENISYGYSGYKSSNVIGFNNIKNRPGIRVKIAPEKYHIQQDIGIDKDFHFRCFASRSLRISSRLRSPKLAQQPASRSEIGVLLLLFNSEAGRKVRIVRPAGNSGGSSKSKWTNLLSGMFTVCSMVMYQT